VTFQQQQFAPRPLSLSLSLFFIPLVLIVCSDGEKDELNYARPGWEGGTGLGRAREDITRQN